LPWEKEEKRLSFLAQHQSSTLHVNWFMRPSRAAQVNPSAPHRSANPGDGNAHAKGITMKNVKIENDIAVLTEEQTAQVAGGLVISPVSPVGVFCRTCTSGNPILFLTEVANLAK
jgi:hypothetical protein